MSDLPRPIRLEVTGTNAAVAMQAPLWILEGKARYADEHPDEDIFIVHVLNPPQLKRAIIRVLPARGLCDRYPVEIKRPYGAAERYVVVPVTAPEIMREEVFLRWLADKTTRTRQPMLPMMNG